MVFSCFGDLVKMGKPCFLSTRRLSLNPMDNLTCLNEILLVWFSLLLNFS